LADNQVPVTIIGAGPVGLFAVFTCGMMRLKCRVIETLPILGGQCQELYPEKPIFDIPGFPQVLGKDLVSNLLKQIKPFDPQMHLGETVMHLSPQKDGWTVHTSKQLFKTSVVIIASGAGSFQPNRPPLAGIETLENKHVFYAVREPDLLRGKTVVIAGGGDSAVDWAISLVGVAKKIYVVHRRPQFRAAGSSVDHLHSLAAAEKLELVIPYQLHALQMSEDQKLTHVVVKTLEGEKQTLPADTLLPFFGLKSDVSFLENWGIELQHHRIKVDPLTGCTSQKGIYAIGDGVIYPHKRKLILTGFAEAAQAATHIRQMLSPNQPFTPQHSTTSGIPTLS
jgi:thioredoxin reductase (NADPH)